MDRGLVLMGYGTGAIMAAPAVTQRDFEFARLYGWRSVRSTAAGAEPRHVYVGLRLHRLRDFRQQLERLARPQRHHDRGRGKARPTNG